VIQGSCSLYSILFRDVSICKLRLMQDFAVYKVSSFFPLEVVWQSGFDIS